MAVEQLTIDVASQDDLEVLPSLLVRANEAYRAVLDPAAFEPYLRMVLDLDGRADAATVLVARAGDGVVGTVTFFPAAADEGWGGRADTSGLRTMAVDPDVRGLGIGRRLVDACVDLARGIGAVALELHTADWLPEAIRLYERCGFVRDPAEDRRASELMDVPAHADYLALAYRLAL